MVLRRRTLYALAAVTLIGCAQDPASAPTVSQQPLDGGNTDVVQDSAQSGGDVAAVDLDTGGLVAQDSVADVAAPVVDIAAVDIASSVLDVTASDSAGPVQFDSGASSPVDVVTDATKLVDVSSGDIAAATPDSAPANCICPPSQAWLSGACVPNSQLGCGPTCVAGQSKGCSANAICVTAQASASCVAPATMAACVPKMAMTFADGSLRLSPTLVNKGDKVTVTIRGGMFYIGALYWMVRIGEQVLEPANDAKAACTLTIDWVAAKAGTFAVAVAYGAQGGPNIGWTLVGFVSVAAGQPGAQPGLACDKANPCAQASPYSCSCNKGSCGCSKP
jgi:hypothetical protein